MATAVSTPSAPSQPRQNWILSGIADHLLIIIAPILGLLWGISTYFLAGGGLNGAAVVWGIFMIFNVAHHFPTFVRIYGDASLVKRFRWSLLMAPILVFTASICLCCYLVFVKQFHISYIIYLGIILTIWDPWHFLMQHYGFVRIYDRHNHAPRQIAARMDFWLCASWFTFCMVAATGWLPSLIYDFYHHFGVPLLFFLNGPIFQALWLVSLLAAVSMTVVYVLYLGWCRRNGYYISTAKLLLLLITFSVMYLTYAPNPLMQSMVPGWTFSMGFAVIGMVHVSQYLAIVWKYNRSLASREGAARTPLFSRLFGSRGRVLLMVMCGYVLACLLYGSFFSDYGKQLWFSLLQIDGPDFQPGNTLAGILQGLVIVTGAVAFTSTLTHYYFDGFIWKVRHKENRQNLAMTDDKPTADRQVSEKPADTSPPEQGVSWFESSGAQPIGRVLVRQSLYFLLPMGLLTALFWMSRDNQAEKLPIGNMLNSMQDQQANVKETEERLQIVSSARRAQIEQQSEQRRIRNGILAERAIELVKQQLEIERQMIQLRPLAVQHCYVADLLYERAICQHYWDQIERGEQPSQIIPEKALSQEDLSKIEVSLQEARTNYQLALELPPPYSHREERVVMFNPQRPNEYRPIQAEYLKGQIAEIDRLLGGE